MRRLSLRSVCALAVLVATAAPASAQQWRDFRAARQAGAIESLEVELLYGAGRLTITRSETPFLYDARVHYDTERFQPLRGWSSEGTRGRLRLALTSVDDETGPSTIRMATDLRLGVGAAAAHLDLGDLSLTSVEILTGASQTEVSFSEPNRVRMSSLTFKVGAADFEAEGLGNARFDRLEFTGAIGNVTLDFSGAWEQDATAEIKMGVGELKLRVPRDIGVRIERSSLLIKLDAAGFDRVDGAYVTPNWDSADVQLEIELGAAFGTVKIERI